MKKVTPYSLLVVSLSFVYILFGALKVIGKSPIQDLVSAMVPFMSNPVWFGLLGIVEVLLGLGLLIKSTRAYAALGIIFHLLFTFGTLLLASDKIFSTATIFTLDGEFVMKNLILIAVAWFVFSKEKGGTVFGRIKFRMDEAETEIK